MCQWARVEAHLNSIGEELLALYGPTPEGNPLFPLRLNNRWGEDAPARWHEPKLEADRGRLDHRVGPPIVRLGDSI